MEEAGIAQSTKRVAVVTGSNKGIGLEICRQLASNGVTVILTARDENRGLEAVQNLKASGLSDMLFHQLDVTNQASVASLAEFIKTKFNKLDILVNNAGINGTVIDPEFRKDIKIGIDDSKQAVSDEIKGHRANMTLYAVNNQHYLKLWGQKQNGFDADAIAEEYYRKHPKLVGGPNAKLKKEMFMKDFGVAEACLKTNYYGVKLVTEELIPLLQLSDSPRIVNVSSTMGQLKFMSHENAKKELTNVDGLTVEKVDELVEEFLEDYKEDLVETKGWPATFAPYTVSKAALNGYTRVMARNYPHIPINAVCPGYVKTDINLNCGILTVEQGAKGPVMLALAPSPGPSGLFYGQMEVSTFE